MESNEEKSDAAARKEDTRKNIALIVSIFGPLFTLITIVIGIYQYRETQRHSAIASMETQRRSVEMEFLRLDIQRQVDTYVHMCNALGRLAAATNDDRLYQERFRDFLTIYWGESILIEDRGVARAMKELRIYAEENVSLDNQASVNKLNGKIMAVAEECKASIDSLRMHLKTEILR